MKIAVIAANGRSGKTFVEAALRAGHVVRAGVFGAHDFRETPQLKVIECDAIKKEAIGKLIKECDVVVSLIGHTKGAPDDVQTLATSNSIEAMRAEKIKRFVSLTGTGVRFPGDRISIIDRIMTAGIKLIDPVRVRDGIHHVELLTKSNLDWTVLRVSKLQNTAPKPFTLKKNGPPKLYVSREEVAQAIVEVLQDNSFIKQAPIIGYNN